MRPSIIALFFVFLLGQIAFAQTWNGSASSDWNTASNWTPATIPGAGNNVTINNALAPNQPILPSNLSIRDLIMSAGSLNLGGFTLTITRNANITGGTIENGSMLINDINNLQNTVFNGSIAITKTGGGIDDLQGGNTFNGPTIINNNDNSRLRFATTNGDTFNSTVSFIKNSTGNIEIAYLGSTTFATTVTIDNGSNGDITFGGGGGTSVLNAGGLTTTNFTGGDLIINNFDQVTATANGIFNPATFTVSEVVFLGSFQVNTTGNMTFNDTNFFNGTNVFTSGGDIRIPDGNNRFSAVSGTTTMIRNGGGGVTWASGNIFGGFSLTENDNSTLTMEGTNTFNRTTTITNNSNTNLIFANVSGDTFNGPVTFQNNGSAFMDIARRGTNVFNDQITINNTGATGEIRFGEFGGTSQLTSGGLVTTDFLVGNILEINNFTQLTTAANGSFNANTIRFNNSTFRGDLQATTTGTGNMEFQNANGFEGNNVFTASSRILIPAGGNTFSLPGATTTMTKNGGGNDTWGAGNSFGNLILTNNTSSNLILQGGDTFHNAAEIYNNGNGQLRLANTLGNDFLSTSLFQNVGASTFDISYNGTNTFADNITVNNLNAGGTVRIGQVGGISTQSSGGLTTSSFSVGADFRVLNFTQQTNAPNGSFTVNTFDANNSFFLGDFSVITLTGDIGIVSSTFNGNNLFDAANGIGVTGGNNFSTTAGNTTTFINRGTANDNWQGGNVFGNLILENNSTGTLRMANSVGGDLITGNAIFRRTNTGVLDLARASTTNYRGNITLEGGPTFGASGGIVSISGGSNRSLNADAAVTIPRLEMNTTGAAIFTINEELTISNSLTLNDGIIFNDENLLSFNDNVSVTGGSNESHVDGRIRKIGNDGFTFPFGNDGLYAPLTMSTIGGSTAQHFTGRYFHTNPELSGYTRASKEATLGEVNECEYWEFDRTNSTVTPTITLSWSSDRTCPIVDFNEFVVTQWNGTQWIDLEASGLSGDDNSGIVTNNIAIPSFSPPIFTLAQSFRILPVELLSFNATATAEKQVRVTWATASEENNAYFTVERSLDGRQWVAIGIVPGVGNSDQIQTYEFMDEKPVFGRQFYRIKQTDFDGKTQTFRVAGVTLTGDAFEIDSYRIYPNPSAGQLKILSENTNLEQAEIVIINTIGQEMQRFENVHGRLFEADLSHLPKGIYLVRIRNSHQVQSKRFVLE